MTDSTENIAGTIDGVILHDLAEARERFGNGPGFGPIFDVTNGENARHLEGKIQFGHYRDGVFYASVPGEQRGDDPRDVLAAVWRVLSEHVGENSAVDLANAIIHESSFDPDLGRYDAVSEQLRDRGESFLKGLS